MDEIDKTILAFEKYNGLKIEDYVSPSGRACYSDRNLRTDKNIGKDIFKQKIENWLDLFDPKDKSLYMDLLKRYRYYPEQVIKNIIYDLAYKIKDQCCLPGFEDIYFVTFASKQSRVCGGDSLRAYLRTELILNDNNCILDTSPNLSDICEKAKAIVILDDVVGSGMTMYGRTISLINKLDLTKHPNIKVYVAFICANEKKIKKKIKEIFKATSVNTNPIIHEPLKKGLSRVNFNTDDDYTRALEITEKYDRLLYNNRFADDNEQDCIRGFENSQLLLSFCYNTPNNTIAAFWRPSEISIPLFYRGTCLRHRISIDKLKDRRKQAMRNSYNCY